MKSLQSLLPWLTSNLCYQISLYACYQFDKIFETLASFQDQVQATRAYCNQSSAVAAELGKLSARLDRFERDLGAWEMPEVSILEIYPDIASTLKYLRWVGHGFGKEGFEKGVSERATESRQYSICMTPANDLEQGLQDEPISEEQSFRDVAQSISSRQTTKTLCLDDYNIQVTLPKIRERKFKSDDDRNSDITDGMLVMECLRQQLECWQKTQTEITTIDVTLDSDQCSVRPLLEEIDEDKPLDLFGTPSLQAGTTNVLDGVTPVRSVHDDDLYHGVLRTEICNVKRRPRPASQPPPASPPQYVSMQDVECHNPQPPSPSIPRPSIYSTIKRKASTSSSTLSPKPKPPIFESKHHILDEMLASLTDATRERALNAIEGPRLNPDDNRGQKAPLITMVEPAYDPLFQAGYVTNRPLSFPPSRRFRKSVGKAVRVIRGGLREGEGMYEEIG